MKKHIITIEHELTDEDLNDIVDAMMHGIHYWATDLEKVKDSKEPQHIEYLSEALTNGWALRFTDTIEDTPYKLTKEKLLKGIALAVKNGYAELDNIDSVAADCIVQYALFGEVRYS